MTWQEFWCYLGWHDLHDTYCTTIIVERIKRIDKQYATCKACKKKFQMSTEYFLKVEREVEDDVDDRKS